MVSLFNFINFRVLKPIAYNGLRTCEARLCRIWAKCSEAFHPPLGEAQINTFYLISIIFPTPYSIKFSLYSFLKVSLTKSPVQ